MKPSIALATAALLTLGSVANAHTHVKASVPAEGSVVAASPSNIVLTFSEATRLTALTVQKEGEAEQKLSSLPSTATENVTVPSPKLTPGNYVLTWRALGDDGHVMDGKVHFTVNPTAPAKAGKAPPDHDQQQH